MQPDHQLAPDTYYAPAGRVDAFQLERQCVTIQTTRLFQKTIDAVSALIVVLNEQRQVVGANRAFVEFLSIDFQRALGKRVGELMGCRCAHLGPDGCGTAADCMFCDAVNCVLDSQRTDVPATRDCQVERVGNRPGMFEFRLNASPVQIGSYALTVCVLSDITCNRRLAAAERILLGDFAKAAERLQPHIQSSQDARNTESDACQQSYANQLIEQLEMYRDLRNAELGGLKPQLAPIQVTAFLKHVCDEYAWHAAVQERNLKVASTWCGSITSDARLLQHILGSMIVNAAEAVSPGESITLDCYREGSSVVLSVHNPGVIDDQIRPLLFHRWFSTKQESGRGLGTRSMKLFGEHGLGGKVSFTSCSELGTTFRLTLPIADS